MKKGGKEQKTYSFHKIFIFHSFSTRRHQWFPLFFFFTPPLFYFSLRFSCFALSIFHYLFLVRLFENKKKMNLGIRPNKKNLFVKSARFCHFPPISFSWYMRFIFIFYLFLLFFPESLGLKKQSAKEKKLVKVQKWILFRMNQANNFDWITNHHYSWVTKNKKNEGISTFVLNIIHGT